MELSTIWWLLAGGAVIAELLTGTFYLLMLGLGLAAGAIAAHAGLGVGWQYLVSAGVGIGSIAIWHSRKKETNPSVHLDIGSTVNVEHWSSNGEALVHYRGARWAARLTTTSEQEINTIVAPHHFKAGLHRIAAIEGNTLVLVKA